MSLKVLIPTQFFAHLSGTTRIVAESHGGAVEILPHRLDCVGALTPGFLEYATRAGGTAYLALHDGMLRNLDSDRDINGADVAPVHEALHRGFPMMDSRDGEIRSAVADLAGGLVLPPTEFRLGR
jgi:F-type H+-transporting ATPase subunit epsilon